MSERKYASAAEVIPFPTQEKSAVEMNPEELKAILKEIAGVETEITRTREEFALIMEASAKPTRDPQPWKESWKIRFLRRIVDRPENPFQQEAEHLEQSLRQRVDRLKKSQQHLSEVTKEQLDEARELVEEYTSPHRQDSKLWINRWYSSPPFLGG